jgi:hypothetical protein
MAYTKSGWYTNSLLAPLTNVAQTGTGGWSLSLNTWKVSLLTYASVTDGSSPVQFQTTTQAWVNTFEAIGTGWVTTGYTLATSAVGATDVVAGVTLTGASPYALTYTWTNPLSRSGTTLTGVGGLILYADPLSAPIVKPMILSLCFGAAYSTVAGVFGVTPSGTGLSVLTLTQ